MSPALLLLWEAKDSVQLVHEKQILEGTCLEKTEVECQFPGILASQLAQNSKLLLVLGTLIFGASGQI